MIPSQPRWRISARTQGRDAAQALGTLAVPGGWGCLLPGQHPVMLMRSCGAGVQTW